MSNLQSNLLTHILGIYMFLIPWDSYLVIEYSLPLFPSYLVIVVVFFIFLFYMIINNLYTFKIPRFLLPLFFLLIFSTFSLVWTSSLNDGVNEISQLWIYFLITILILFITQNKEVKIKKVLWLYIVGTVSVGVYSIIINHGYHHYRFTIIDGYNPTWYSAFIVWAIVVSVVLYRNGKFLSKIIILILNLLLIFFLLLTQGRNSILAIVVSLFIVLFINFISYIKKGKHLDILIPKKHIRTILFLLSFTTFIVIFVYNIGLSEHLTKIENLKELIGGDSNLATAGRTSIWENYINAKSGSFLIGSGVGSALTEYKNINIINLSAIETHNSYLLTFIEYGILGLILWVSFLFLITRFSLNNSVNSHYLLWLSLIFIFMSIGNDTLTYRYWWVGLMFYLLISNLEKGKSPIVDN